MVENSKYAGSNQELQDIVAEFLGKIEEFLRNECFEEMEMNEIAGELSKITPTLATILSKWVPEIVYGLYFGKMSFNDIKRMIPISSRVLSDKLRVLEETSVIVRIVEEGRPPRVYYELTSLGRTIALSLIPLLVVVKLSA